MLLSLIALVTLANDIVAGAASGPIAVTILKRSINERGQKTISSPISHSCRGADAPALHSSSRQKPAALGLRRNGLLS